MAREKNDMTTERGVRVLYGMGCVIPKLPIGLVVHEWPKAFVTVTDAEGKQYLIAMGPPRLVPIIKFTKLTDIHADFDNPILL
jgi:hypothetical protein